MNLKTSKKIKKEPKTIEEIMKEQFHCKDIYEHWGNYWWLYNKVIEIITPGIIQKTQWKYNKVITIESKYISRILLVTQPDHMNKTINIQWENVKPNRHSLQEILHHNMNQYFRTVKLNELIKKSKNQEKLPFVPTKYLFCYGKYLFEEQEIEDVIFSIHFPFFMNNHKDNEASLLFSISLNLPSLTTSLTRNQYFFDMLYDSINLKNLKQMVNMWILFKMVFF